MSKPSSQCEANEIAKRQYERRMKNRQEFLRLRTDPCKNAMESGFVFDEALQRYQAMKCKSYEYFRPNPRNGMFTVLALAPFFIYGAIIYWDRDERETDIRCGRLRYRDRLFKFQ